MEAARRVARMWKVDFLGDPPDRPYLFQTT